MKPYASVVFSVCLILVGCHLAARPTPPSEPVKDALSGIAGVEAHTRSADRHVQHAVPHANPEGKVLLTAASEEHNEVLADAVEVRRALSEASGQVASLQERLTNEQERYAHLAGQWYVAWGRRIEQAFWILGIGWLLCGVASVALGLGSPLSLTWRLGKEITRFLPAMNLFSWVRDWLLRRWELANPTIATTQRTTQP